MKGAARDSDFEDDDDDDLGRLGSEHVEKLHFGGGEEQSGDPSGKESLRVWGRRRSSFAELVNKFG